MLFWLDLGPLFPSVALSITHSVPFVHRVITPRRRQTSSGTCKSSEPISVQQPKVCSYHGNKQPIAVMSLWYSVNSYLTNNCLSVV